MDFPKFIVSNQKEESISIQGVNLRMRRETETNIYDHVPIEIKIYGEDE